MLTLFEVRASAEAERRAAEAELDLLLTSRQMERPKLDAAMARAHEASADMELLNRALASLESMEAEEAVELEVVDFAAFAEEGLQRSAAEVVVHIASVGRSTEAAIAAASEATSSEGECLTASEAAGFAHTEWEERRGERRHADVQSDMLRASAHSAGGRGASERLRRSDESLSHRADTSDNLLWRVCADISPAGCGDGGTPDALGVHEILLSPELPLSDEDDGDGEGFAGRIARSIGRESSSAFIGAPAFSRAVTFNSEVRLLHPGDTPFALSSQPTTVRILDNARNLTRAAPDLPLARVRRCHPGDVRVSPPRARHSSACGGRDSFETPPLRQSLVLSDVAFLRLHALCAEGQAARASLLACCAAYRSELAIADEALVQLYAELLRHSPRPRPVLGGLTDPSNFRG